METRVARRGAIGSARLAERVGVFRPAYIQPLHGIRSRTRLYNVLYALLWPLTYLLPSSMKTTTERLGRALLNVVRSGFDKRILESADINRAAAQS